MRVEFLTSNETCAEGAMAAGLNVYIGYPITPSSDLFEYLAEKLPKRGGIVYQGEDEIASINALVGASLAGAKAMTATSGPGLSLMQEGIGLAIMLEAPLVIVSDMRTGPSTGIATQIGQGDIMQARWGSHGPYNLVVYAPASAQEAFDYTVKAFNTAVRLRVPVIVLMDAILAHTREKVVIKEPGEIEVVEFKKTKKHPGEYKPYEYDPDDLVPPIAFFGEGYKVLHESLAHDERGYYKTSPEVYRPLVERFIKKVNRNRKYVVASKDYYADDAETLFIAIGSVARSTLALVRDLRESGLKVGLFRPISIWPFDEDRFIKMARRVKKIIVAEMNQGQLVWIIKKILWDNKLFNVDVYSLPLLLPDLPSPDEIYDEIKSRGWKI
ncbi:2-oxoacid:acceptor oxidoreductase subunit alpha [Candidatus Geothermarchaeota archaeon]|nr:MAG: 2-oxoacid:acceptor oxidoreductase subunit alpha [Candidatus Geothermarchaeota archaeon]